MSAPRASTDTPLDNSVLVMLELEAGQPSLALDYCSELIHVAAQMGKGSEAPHAVALDAVIHYLLQETDAPEE